MGVGAQHLLKTLYFSHLPSIIDGCASFWGDPEWDSWTHSYRIVGGIGEKVDITLTEDPDGQSNISEATLTITDLIDGADLLEYRRGVLPLELQLSLPATGPYRIETAAMPRQNGAWP
jgi:hypothetical protein